MPGSKQSSFALLITLHFCGVATAFGQHDNYVQKLNEFSKSPDPELTDGILSNEVFSLEIGSSFSDILHASTSFKYYTTIDMVRLPNGIFAPESDRLVIKTQEVLLENGLAQMVNDDLHNFSNDSVKLTGEIEISEFRVGNDYDVLFWEGTQVTSSSTNRKLYSFHLRGPKIYEGTSFSNENYVTWLHIHFFFESENGTMTFQEARKIIESIEFLDSMNIPFDLEEKSNVTASFPLFSKDPRWYESTWFGNYYDSTKGWLFHEYLGWIYTEGAVEGGVWFWHDNIGWFWTKDGTYPYLYSQYSADWLFLDLNSLDPKRYYNFAISEWVNLSQPNIDVQLAALLRNNSGTTNPRGLKRQAIQIISESDIPEEEANKRIAKIILYGL